MEKLIETFMEHFRKKRYLDLREDRFEFTNVTFLLLKCPKGNPRLIGYSHPTQRYGVIPIFFNSDGIIFPFKYKNKFHDYLEPFRYYYLTLERYLDIFYKKKVSKIVETLESSIISLKTHSLNMIPFFAENFGHEMCQLLSLYDYLETSREKGDFCDSVGSSTQTLNYKSYPHLYQMNQMVSDNMNKKFSLIENYNQLYHLDKVTFIPTRMRAFPDVSLKPGIDLILSQIPDQPKVDKVGIIKSVGNECYAFNGPPKKNRAPGGAFLPKVIQKLRTTNGYDILNHEDLDFKSVVTYLKNAKEVILSWGAVSYWGQFLNNQQRCYVLWHHHYGEERKIHKKKPNMNRNRICFDNNLFNNYLISEKFNGSNPMEISQWIEKSEKSIIG